MEKFPLHLFRTGDRICGRREMRKSTSYSIVELCRGFEAGGRGSGFCVSIVVE